jgi:hypothetical protein
MDNKITGKTFYKIKNPHRRERQGWVQRMAYRYAPLESATTIFY